jgi:hypothetical protein
MSWRRGGRGSRIQSESPQSLSFPAGSEGMAVALPPPVIRITTVNSNGLTLIVEGQLSGPAVEELRNSCAGVRGREVVVDVSGVVFADSLAASLLKELDAAGFVIQGCSGFIRELLR